MGEKRTSREELVNLRMDLLRMAQILEIKVPFFKIPNKDDHIGELHRVATSYECGWEFISTVIITTLDSTPTSLRKMVDE